MRVGVLVGSHGSRAGGARTLQEEVCRGIDALAAQSAHSFVEFLAQGDPMLKGFGGAGVERLERRRPTLRERAAAGRARGAGFGIGKDDPWLDSAVREQSIECLWALGPGHVPDGIPYLGTVWDLEYILKPWFPEVSSNGEWARRDALYRPYIQRATRVITGTKAGRAEVSSLFRVPEDRVEVIPFPVPRFAVMGEGATEEEVRSRYGLRRDYVLYPAQLWPHKNHEALLAAVSQLRRHKGRDLELVIVGGDAGNGRFLSKRARELGIDDAVHMIEFVPREDLVGLYRGATALVFVSYFGPDNIPPLEAFALGCPVVVSDSEGSAEQFGEAALRVDPGNPEQIASAIESVQDDAGLRSRLIERGRARASSWSGEDYVRAVLSVLDDFALVRGCWA
jgi:glycosyltransferase involved in cell wall biosynthesis